MTRIFRILAATACLAALVGVTGCGDDDDSGGAPAEGTSTAEPAGASGLPKLDGQKAVYVGYGGITGETAEKVWLEPFSEATGATVTYDEPSDPAKVKAMVESGNVQWDLIDLDGASGGANCGTLFKTRDELGVDTSEVDPKYLTDDCGIPIEVQAQTLLYNKEKYGDNPPTKVTDFLDTERFPGKRALFNYSVGAWEPLILAAGTPAEQLYPIDFNVGTEAYNKIKDDIVLQNELAQQGEQLSSGNFDMCMCYTGRAAITPGIDPDKVGVVWDGNWNAYDMLYAIKDSKVPELQAAFMNWIAKHETQAAFTKVQPYEPGTKGDAPEVPEAFKYWMPSYNKDQLTNQAYVDYEYLSDPKVAAEVQEKWTALTSG